MDILSELDARREIDAIVATGCTAMRKTRLLLRLSRRIRHSIVELDRSLEILSEDAAARIRDRRRALHCLNDEVRSRAIRALRSERGPRLGFGYGPQVAPTAGWRGRAARTR